MSKEEIIDEINETTVEETSTPDVKLAKAGKRSAKGLKEQEEKLAKEERKAHASEEIEEESKPKVIIKTRTRLERQGKKFRAAAEKIEKDKVLPLSEAIKLATETSPVKFDATVELHFKLNVDPRQADQNIRGNLVLPHGLGKSVTVAVFADGDDLNSAKKAGADIAGSEEFLQQLEKGQVNFDILVTTPQMMPKLSKYARLLGPKGLMPNPKSGTVTKDVAKVIADSKAGRLEFRVDSGGNIHVPIGKVSFGADKLIDNANAFISVLKSAKPASVKSTYIQTIHTTTSMGPSIKVSL